MIVTMGQGEREGGSEGGKEFFSNKDMERILKLYQDWNVRPEKLLPICGKSIPFSFDLDLISVEDGNRSQVLNRAVREDDHLTCIFRDVSYKKVALDVGCDILNARGFLF